MTSGENLGIVGTQIGSIVGTHIGKLRRGEMTIDNKPFINILDEWIAENIFGFEVCRYCDRPPFCREFRNGGNVSFDMPRYSTDITSALEVIEELDKCSSDCTFYLSYKNGTFRCRFNNNTTTTDKSAAMAICLASFRLITGYNWRITDEDYNCRK